MNNMFFILLKRRMKSNRKKNIALLIPISIILLFVFFSNLFYYSLEQYINSFKNNIELRTISIDYFNKDNFENIKHKIEKNDNIKMIVSEYERAPYSLSYCLQLANDNKDGIVFLKPINIKVCPEVIKGRKITDNDKYVVILPNKIYANSEIKDIILQNEYTNCENLINQEIDIKFENDVIKKFKVIGIYDSEIYKETETLYVPAEVIKEINNELGYTPKNFKLEVVVDKIENLESVNNYIYDNNIVEKNTLVEEREKSFNNDVSFIERETINESNISLDTFKLIKSISYFLLIVSIFLFLLILLVTDIDKVYYSSREIGLMRIQGYKEKQIQLLTIIENIIISIISFIISLILLIIIEKIIWIFINNFISKDYIGITYNEIKNQLFYIKDIPWNINVINISITFIAMILLQLINTFIINKYVFSKTISDNLKMK